MLRTLVVVLLLANALMLAWSLGALDGLLGRRPDADREPERLQRQVNPDLVKLLPPAAASAPAAAASQAPSGTAAAGEAPVCLEAGPLPAATLANAEKALLAAGVAAGSWTTEAAPPKGVYLIYMGRYEDDETLQRKLEEVKRRRIDARPVRQADLQPGIEVDRFDDKAAADEALVRLSQRGLRTARVLPLGQPQPQVLLRLAAAAPAQSDALAALKLAPGVDGFRRCTPSVAGPVVAAASAAASAAAVPAALGPATAPAAPRARAAAPGSSSATTSGSRISGASAAPAAP
jgi:hypothetical protein